MYVSAPHHQRNQAVETSLTRDTPKQKSRRPRYKEVSYLSAFGVRKMRAPLLISCRGRHLKFHERALFRVVRSADDAKGIVVTEAYGLDAGQ
jgi:hypothetical protein